MYYVWCVGGCYQNTNNKSYHVGGLSPASVSNQCFFEAENVGGKEMVETKKLHLYFFPRIFQPFSILDIRRISDFKTEPYILFLGTVYLLCMEARGIHSQL